MQENLYTEGRYLSNNPTWHTEDSSWKANQILKMITRNELQIRRICEVGCGAGEVLRSISAKLGPGVSCVGYDISPQAIELCVSREAPSIEYRLGDGLGDEAGYDLAMAIDVVEHVEDHLAFLRKIKQIATYKVFHFPLDLSVQSLLRATPILRTHREVGHIRYFFKETALNSLLDTGHDVQDYFYTGTGIDMPTRSLKNLIARTPRRLMYAINKDFAVRLLGGFSLMVLTK